MGWFLGHVQHGVGCFFMRRRKAVSMVPGLAGWILCGRVGHRAMAVVRGGRIERGGRTITTFDPPLIVETNKTASGSIIWTRGIIGLPLGA